MDEQDVVLTVQKLEPGQTERMEDQYETQNERREVIEEQLRDEGVNVESAFIVPIDGDDYVIHYFEAEDFDEALATHYDYAEKTERVKEYDELVDEILVGGVDNYHQHRESPRFHVVVDQNDR